MPAYAKARWRSQMVKVASFQVLVDIFASSVLNHGGLKLLVNKVKSAPI